MAAAIGLREDFGSAELPALAKRVKDAAQASRLLPLAMIYDGGRRTNSARIAAEALAVDQAMQQASIFSKRRRKRSLSRKRPRRYFEKLE